MTAQDTIPEEDRFAKWSDKMFADQCRMQARDNLDPEYSAFMNALADRIAERQRDQWQPIETAPKDGRFILVNSPRPMQRLAMVAWQGRGARSGWYGVDDCGLTFDAVTHGLIVGKWMPLPSAPKGGEA